MAMSQEFLGRGLLLVLALEFDVDPRIETGGRQPGAQLAHFGVGQHVRRDFGSNRHHAALVDPAQDSDLGPRFARDEVGDRYHAHVGAHADARPVLAELGAVGDHAHVAADECYVGAELGGFGAVDSQLPFDSGDRAAILDVGESADLGHGRGDARRRRTDQFRQIGGDFELDRLADRRAAVNSIWMVPIRSSGSSRSMPEEAKLRA
jgi:hypothetical protein